jgi:hypothetical protein
MKSGRWAAAWCLALAAAATTTPAAERCVSFDLAQMSVREADGRWQVTDGAALTLEFTTQSDAARALAVLRYYDLDKICRIGEAGAGITYFLSGDDAPSGPMPGEDAAALDLASLELRQNDGRWMLVEAGKTLADFGTSEADARLALDLIRKRELDHLCVVGRPAGMTYWRSSPRAEIVKGEDALLLPDPGKAALRVFVVEGPDRTPAARPMITVRPAGTLAGQPVTLSENPGVFTLPSGDYEVTVRTSAESETAPRRASVAPGQTAELVVDLTPGTLELTLTAAGKPLPRAPALQFRCGTRILGSASESPARFQAIAGTYQARLQLMGGQFLDIPDLEIRAGETNARTVEVPCAQLTVTVSGGGYGESDKPLPYVELDRNGRMVTALTANPARFQVLSGAYEVFVREDDKRLGLQRITLEPGQELDLKLDVSGP